MAGPASFVDEIDCGNFFDHIDDLLDFPEENNNDNDNCLIGGNSDSFPDIWTDPSGSFPSLDRVFPGKNTNSNSDISTELYVPYEDIVQMEWLPNFVEDSLSGGSSMPTLEKEDSSNNKVSSPNQSFRTSSPISVLESSSSCSGGGKTAPLSPETMPASGRRGRPRSKRPRPATFNPRPSIQLISPTSSFTGTEQPFLSPKASSESDNFAESHPLMKIPKSVFIAEPKKIKRIKLSIPSGQEEIDQNCDQNPASSQSGVRKCLHCEITKTPQWRAGPLGPKTLCNACGVRYKSGRLFPEYRPAASPTFVPSLHSNSHKKVVEMRTRISDNVTVVGNETTELIPNKNPLVDYM